MQWVLIQDPRQADEDIIQKLFRCKGVICQPINELWSGAQEELDGLKEEACNSYVKLSLPVIESFTPSIHPVIQLIS